MIPLKPIPTAAEKAAYRWHPFDEAKGYRQKRPPEKRYVLLAFDYDGPPGSPGNWEKPAHCAVGYLKYSSGRKGSPFFVTPKVGGIPTHWCDCLGDNFWMPHWAGKQRNP